MRNGRHERFGPRDRCQKPGARQHHELAPAGGRRIPPERPRVRPVVERRHAFRLCRGKVARLGPARRALRGEIVGQPADPGVGVGGEAGEDFLHPAQDRVGVLLHRIPRRHFGVGIGQRGLGRHEPRGLLPRRHPLALHVPSGVEGAETGCDEVGRRLMRRTMESEPVSPHDQPGVHPGGGLPLRPVFRPGAPQQHNAVISCRPSTGARACRCFGSPTPRSPGSAPTAITSPRRWRIGRRRSSTCGAIRGRRRRSATRGGGAPSCRALPHHGGERCAGRVVRRMEESLGVPA